MAAALLPGYQVERGDCSRCRCAFGGVCVREPQPYSFRTCCFCITLNLGGETEMHCPYATQDANFRWVVSGFYLQRHSLPLAMQHNRLPFSATQVTTVSKHLKAAKASITLASVGASCQLHCLPQQRSTARASRIERLLVLPIEC